MVFPLLARESINRNLNYLKTVYEKKYKTYENWPIFINFISLLKPCVKIMVINYAVCTVSFIVGPIIVYIFSNTAMEPLLPYFFPGLSPNCRVTFAINYIQQIYVMLYAFGAFTLHNVLFFVQILHVILLTNIQKTKIWRISRMAAAPEPSYLKISMYLRTIVIAHNECLA